MKKALAMAFGAFAATICAFVLANALSPGAAVAQFKPPSGGTVNGTNITPSSVTTVSETLTGSSNALTFTDINARITWASTNFCKELTATGHVFCTGGVDAPSVSVSALGTTNPLVTSGAPSISSGFGSSPSIVANNGSAAFQVNVGTGASASSGVLSMPFSAATGWVCNCMDLSSPSTTTKTFMTANSVNTCTVTNQTVTTGSAVAWASAAKLWCSAFPL